MLSYDELLQKYNTALKTIESLRTENKHLKSKLGIIDEAPAERKAADKSVINKYSSVEAKIRLFRKLFSGREDVFARRWTAKLPEKAAISLFVRTNGQMESATKMLLNVRYVPTENYCRYPTKQFITTLQAKTNTAGMLSAFIRCCRTIPVAFCALILRKLSLKKMFQLIARFAKNLICLFP